jgi:hypothetical protein
VSFRGSAPFGPVRQRPWSLAGAFQLVRALPYPADAAASRSSPALEGLRAWILPHHCAPLGPRSGRATPTCPDGSFLCLVGSSTVRVIDAEVVLTTAAGSQRGANTDGLAPPGEQAIFKKGESRDSFQPSVGAVGQRLSALRVVP